LIRRAYFFQARSGTKLELGIGETAIATLRCREGPTMGRQQRRCLRGHVKPPWACGFFCRLKGKRTGQFFND
jgi:hypothetical protein